MTADDMQERMDEIAWDAAYDLFEKLGKKVTHGDINGAVMKRIMSFDHPLNEELANRAGDIEHRVTTELLKKGVVF